jgi:altered-inheritance-of-mitochondria protein 13
MKKTGSNFD